MRLFLKNLKEQEIVKLFLDRKLSQKRTYPAFDIGKSATRKEDLAFR